MKKKPIVKILSVTAFVVLWSMFAIYFIYFVLPLKKEKDLDAQIDHIIANKDISLCQELPDFDINRFKLPWVYSTDHYRNKCRQRFYDREALEIASQEIQVVENRKKIRSIGNNFTDCNTDLNKFSDRPWFQDFMKAFQTIKIDTEWQSDWLDVCFSTSLQKMIVNVPYVITSVPNFLCGNWGDDESLCKDTVNIYLYDIANWKLTQANRDPKTIIYQTQKWINPEDFATKENQIVLHYWNPYWNSFQHGDIATALRWFEREEGNSIILPSGYGDAWCSSDMDWEYDYVKNVISLKSQKSECVWEEEIQ